MNESYPIDPVYARYAKGECVSLNVWRQSRQTPNFNWLEFSDFAMDKKPSSRLTQYLDFVKLYTDVHKESNAKKEANIIWKQKIQSTSNDELSTMDYLEQLALLKTKKNIQASRPCGHAPDPDIFLDLEIPIEFSCEGASKSVEIAGTFNNWQPEPLKYNSKEGDWVATLNLTPGLPNIRNCII